MCAVVVFEVEKVIELFWSVGGGVQKSSENEKSRCYAALHHGFELSSRNGAHLTSRKVGLRIGGTPFYIIVQYVRPGDMPDSVSLLRFRVFCATQPPTDEKVAMIFDAQPTPGHLPMWACLLWVFRDVKNGGETERSLWKPTFPCAG